MIIMIWLYSNNRKNIKIKSEKIILLWIVFILYGQVCYSLYISSLVHSVIHTYHPDTTSSIRCHEYTSKDSSTRTIRQSVIKLNRIEVNGKPIQLPIPPSWGNLKPSDKIRRDLPPKPYTQDNLQFNQFNFRYSDLTDTV